jgi:hypothetical protein
MVVTQKLTLRPRWKVCLIDIIWAAFANPHHLFAWRVRVSIGNSHPC